MLPLLILIALAALALGLYACITEAIAERDWPRKTAWSLVLVCVSVVFLVAAL